MNITTVTTDGICVYITTNVIPSRALKLVVRIAAAAFITGIILVNFATRTTSVYILGWVFIGLSLFCTLPLARSILWNLYGEETISFSTKSIVSELSYGLFKLPPKTIVYDGRLHFRIEILREEGQTKTGLLHFYGFDAKNQPYHLFRNYGYISEETCYEIIDKIQLIFDLDKDQFTGYSAN